MSTGKLVDLLIAGGGPAGATAALYAARAGLNSVVFEPRALGGEIVSTERLDNYPAFPEGLTGAEFGLLLQQQLENLGVPVYTELIESALLTPDVKEIRTDAATYRGRALLIATGTEPRLLGAPGEEDLRGRGVSYCATCDGAFFRGKKIAVVGGGNAALEETLFLDRFAEKIYLIHRRDRFRGVISLQEKVRSLPGVEILWNTTVQEIRGGRRVESLLLHSEGAARELAVEGVFIYTGRLPNTACFGPEVATLKLDDNGFIVTGERMDTSQAGVYAAGDIRRKFLRQVITAAADGAVAATAVSQYLL